jgi:hypothetical protein
MTKRKNPYQRPKPPRRGPAAPEYEQERPNLATINLSAGAGRAGFSVGDRVVIGGSGMYAGETAVIERLSTGAIPSALVRTEGGQTRQVRTIDLTPAPSKAQADKAAAVDKAAAGDRPAAD